MEVFISWSGTRSRYIAEALKWWLPKVIQALRPWMSDSDIPAGKRWAAEVASKLDSYEVGIICVTPENMDKPWLMFEAGALSKTIETALVCPLVFDMALEHVKSPLDQFQGNLFNRSGMFKVLKTLNRAMNSGGLDSSELDDTFEVWWPKLEARMLSVPPLPSNTPPSLEQQVALLLPVVHALVRQQGIDTTEKARGKSRNSPELAVQERASPPYFKTSFVCNTYEPIARDGRIIGLEAMIRDVDPKFLPKMIAQIEADLDTWEAQGLVVPPIAVSLVELPVVNDEVSAAVFRLARKHGKLSVGITESALMSNKDTVIDYLSRLRELNVSVTVDDFGTGYSSLSYLQLMPVDGLKVARAFIKHIVTSESERLITQTIASLGASLSLFVIAEGVETQEQADTLKQVGIDVLKGPFVGLPMPRDEVTAMLGRGDGAEV